MKKKHKRKFDMFQLKLDAMNHSLTTMRVGWLQFGSSLADTQLRVKKLENPRYVAGGNAIKHKSEDVYQIQPITYGPSTGPEAIQLLLRCREVLAYDDGSNQKDQLLTDLRKFLGSAYVPTKAEESTAGSLKFEEADTMVQMVKEPTAEEPSPEKVETYSIGKLLDVHRGLIEETPTATSRSDTLDRRSGWLGCARTPVGTIQTGRCWLRVRGTANEACAFAPRYYSNRTKDAHEPT